jgi:hypothetical protein
MSSWRYLGWKGHTANIEYAWNRSSEVGRAGLQDFGALYVSCSNAGFTKIHHNYIDGVGVASQNAGIYLDVSTDKAEVYNNVSVNMPARTMNLIYEAWVAVVMSTNVKVYNNWTDQLNFKDFDPARYRYLWGHRSNKRYDNHLIEDGKALPPEAMEVLEKAGVEPQYQQVKEFVDQVIELSL